MPLKRQKPALNLMRIAVSSWLDWLYSGEGCSKYSVEIYTLIAMLLCALMSNNIFHPKLKSFLCSGIWALIYFGFIECTIQGNN